MSASVSAVISATRSPGMTITPIIIGKDVVAATHDDVFDLDRLAETLRQPVSDNIGRRFVPTPDRKLDPPDEGRHPSARHRRHSPSRRAASAFPPRVRPYAATRWSFGWQIPIAPAGMSPRNPGPGQIVSCGAMCPSARPRNVKAGPAMLVPGRAAEFSPRQHEVAQAMQAHDVVYGAGIAPLQPFADRILHRGVLPRPTLSKLLRQGAPSCILARRAPASHSIARSDSRAANSGSGCGSGWHGRRLRFATAEPLRRRCAHGDAGIEPRRRILSRSVARRGTCDGAARPRSRARYEGTASRSSSV